MKTCRDKGTKKKSPSLSSETGSGSKNPSKEKGSHTQEVKAASLQRAKNDKIKTKRTPVCPQVRFSSRWGVFFLLELTPV